MKNLPFYRMNFSVFFFAAALLLMSGCSKTPETVNQKPSLNAAIVQDGLKVTIKGKATDSDGSITGGVIHWGDNEVTFPTGSELAGFEISHYYDAPLACRIRVVVRDNAGDSAVLQFPVNIDFKETSLAGIKPGMFKTNANEFLILTVNLHTYQETRQNEKFNLVVDLIGKMNVDFIAFQECAQNKGSAISSGIIRTDNMALIITNRLKEKYGAGYNFAWNWSHYGWSVWEEGVAVLTKYPIIGSEDRYISTSTSTGSITSRKVIYAACQAPGRLFNIFSAHTHWRISASDEEQNKQISNIKSMVSEKEMVNPDAVSFVCGDFNGNPTSDFPWSEGYHTMMKNNDYSDTFFDIYPDANQVPAQGIYNTIGGDLPGRIDYIFMKKDSRMQVVDSQIIFTNDIVGPVSDHFAVLIKVSFAK